MADTQDKILAQLQALRNRYSTELPAKLQQIRSGLDVLRREWNEELLRTLHRKTHSLTGSGATFGYAEISRSAHMLERVLKQLVESGAGPEHPSVAEIESLLCGLEQADRTARAESESISSTILPRTGKSLKDEHRLIFVVDDDTSLTRAQRLRYELHGYQVREFHDFKGLKEAIRHDRPQALVMEVVFPQGELAGIEEIARLRRDADDFPPVIFVSQRHDMQARLASVRAGASAYFTKPIDLANMLETLDRITLHEPDSPYRVLVVDADESLAYHHALMLQRAGMQTRVLTESTHILELLPEFLPELILMELYLPACTGMELAAVIRQQQTYLGTPILFLAEESDIDRHLDTLRADGGDFLIKPIAPDHLLATVQSRLRRARTINALMVRDSLTGLLNHAAIEEQLMRELGLLLRNDATLSYALLDLDHFKKINDRYGHAAGDQVLRGLSRLLRQRFRQTDLLGRYGGEEFVVVLIATDAQAAARLMDEVRADFSRIEFTTAEKTFRATFSAGVTSAPSFMDPVILQGEANRALHRAKQAGRNQVLIAQH